VLALESGGTFTVHFDAPQIRNVMFRSNGSVDVFVPGVFGGSVGTYVLGETVDLRVEVNLAADTWTIFLDNALAHIGSFGGSTEIIRVRFSTNLTSPPSASVGIDNVVISGDLPIAVESTSWGQIKRLFR
jgi:hypothetical protein